MRKHHLPGLIAMLTLALHGVAADASERWIDQAVSAGAGNNVRLRYADHEARDVYRRGNGHRDDDRHGRRHRDVPLFSIGSFRTRERGLRDTTLGLPDGTAFVQLAGTRRALFVHRAVVRFDDGRSQRLRELEGYLADGDVISSRLRDCVGGMLYLQTSPADRGKRGYAEVLVGVAPPRRHDW